MPRGPKGEKRPADVIGCAIKVAKIATDEENDKIPSGRRLSGLAGAAARNAALNSDTRSEIAKKAAAKRWASPSTPPRKSRARKGKNEALTERIVEKFFRNLGYYQEGTTVVVEPKKSTKPQIQKLLATASKRIGGSGGGYPDFIVRDARRDDFAMVVECKADATMHASESLDQFADYAVDGARLYADYISKEMDVLYVGVSGETEKELKVSHFLKLKGEKEQKEIFKGCGLQEFPSYLEQLRDYRFRVDYEELLTYVSQLNEQLHAKKIPEKERAILFSGILIALEDETFRKSYSAYTDAKRLAKGLVTAIIAKLEASNVPQDRQLGLKAVFTAIQSHTGLIAEGYILELIREIEQRIHAFIKGDVYVDIISRCYIEFLKYANDDGSLGIVLTPPHITELFCDIGQLNTDSVVIDNCCGTGGFLVAAMSKIISAANGDKRIIARIKGKQILGIEWQNHIFNLCVSNMILHGDGKSNIWNDDCFKMVDNLRPFKPTAALLNPPYSDVSGIDELEFIENALSVLEKNGVAVAIVPMRCALYDRGHGLTLKERLLEHHTLDAVMSMPNDLFYPKGAVCCVMVFRAHVPHDSRKKTWFGYWKDDGFTKVKHRGRQDANERWQSIKGSWLNKYLNRETVPGHSVSASIKASDEWCAEVHMETDYSTLTKSDFACTIKNYLMFKLINGVADTKDDSEQDNDS